MFQNVSNLPNFCVVWAYVSLVYYRTVVFAYFLLLLGHDIVYNHGDDDRDDNNNSSNNKNNNHHNHNHNYNDKSQVSIRAGLERIVTIKTGPDLVIIRLC